MSDEVDAKSREQIKAGAFPAPLKAEEWDAGDTVWLLDVIAPTKERATAVVKNFGQVVKDGKLFVHPSLKRNINEAVNLTIGYIRSKTPRSFRRVIKC